MPPVAPPSPSPAAAAALAARSSRRAGLAFSCASLAAAAAAAVAAGVVPGDHLATAAAAALALPAATIAIAKAALGDALVLDAGLPPSVAVVPRWAGPRPDATRSLSVVLDAGAGRGRGVIATAPIPAGAFLGTYAGDLLDTAGFWGRYPSGVADHTMSVGRDWAIDGAPIAAAADAVAAAAAAAGDPTPPPPPYSPCFVNNSATRANVARVTRTAARKVDLYAARAIAPGEEVLLDYGATYWTGREGSMVE